MTPLGWLSLAASACMAVTDWFAVVTSRKQLEYVAKPATMIALIGVALSLVPVSATQQRWFVVALAFGALGDVFLMLPRNLFVAGLAAFLVGHVAYVAGFNAAGVSPTIVALFAVAILLPASMILPGIIQGIRRNKQPALIPAVLVYSLVITAMLASAVATGNALAIVGGVLFYTSDTLIGYNRFVAPRPWMPLAIIVTYHVGQAGLVLSLAV
jgi:uncharacterized membrane protein YhhN